MNDELKARIASDIEQLDPELEVVEVRLGTSRGRTHVSVKVDHLQGVDVEKLSEINRQLGDILDQTPFLKGPYVLEVSSAGVERPLTTPEHFQRFAGRKAKLVLWATRDGNTVFSGVIGGYDNGRVMLDTPQGEVAFPLEDIKKANLVFEM